MYDNTLLASPPPPPPPPMPEMQKHSRLGIGSFISAIVGLLVTCAFFILSYATGSKAILNNSTVPLIGLSLMCLAGLATLTGVGLGIAAVLQKGSNKTFGILGLVFSSLLLTGICLFIVFAIFVAGSIQYQGMIPHILPG